MGARDDGCVPPSSRRAVARLLLSVGRDRIGLMRALAGELGDAGRFRLGGRYLYFFNHPDHAKHVLVDNAGNYRKGIGLRQARRVLGDGLLTSEGAQWAGQRRDFAAMLRHWTPAAVSPAVMAETRHALDAWPADAPIDLVAATNALTLRVVERTLVRADLGPKEALIAALAAVQEQAMFEMVTLGALPQWLPLPRFRRYRRAQRHLERLVSRLLADHERDGPWGVMTRDELVALLLTSHQTTASALGWTLYEVSRDPAVGDRVAHEARTALGPADDPDPRSGEAVLKALPYTTAVVQESLRLHPPVWLLPRSAYAEDRVGDFRVPAGTDVLICPYTLHRHPAFWAQPDAFRPERFSPRERGGPRHRYAYLPFGAGVRVCPGVQHGLSEVVLVTAMVARERRLAAVPGPAPRAKPMLTLQPDRRVRILAERRPRRPLPQRM
jgi:cytochrome P450